MASGQLSVVNDARSVPDWITDHSPLTTSHYFTTLASLARIGTWAIGSAPGVPPAELAAARRLLLLLASILPALDHLDERHLLPLGYACVAERPEG